MRDLGFDDHFLSIVYECMPFTSFQVLLNGEKSNAFNPSRGLRQRYPLSSYLFVLCVERLSQLIQLKVNDTVWRPIKLTSDGHVLSHLFFANNLLLFFEAFFSTNGGHSRLFGGIL